MADTPKSIRYAEWRPIRFPLPDPTFERWASISWAALPAVFVFSHHIWVRVAVIVFVASFAAWVVFRERRFRRLVAALAEQNELDDDAFIGVTAATLLRGRFRI